MVCGIFEFEINAHLKATGDRRAVVVSSGGELPLLDGTESRCFEVVWWIRLLDGRIYDMSININGKLQNDKSLDAASSCIFWIVWRNLLQKDGWMLERLPVGHVRTVCLRRIG